MFWTQHLGHPLSSWVFSLISAPIAGAAGLAVAAGAARVPLWRMWRGDDEDGVLPSLDVLRTTPL
jgi:hypothetical protein